MKFKGDIIITDPCYVIRRREDRDNIKILGFTTFISESTLYGNWSCKTLNLKNKNPKEFIDDVCNTYQESEKIKGLYGKLSSKYKEAKEKVRSKTVNLEILGDFCADSGQVGVFLLDEVLRYNPEFINHTDRPWTTTLIKNFNGDIEYYIDLEGQAHILGSGNTNFCTIQTGF